MVSLQVMRNTASADAGARGVPFQSFRLLGDEQFLEQCELDTFRGPGPGGQKRNKTSSSVRLTHVPTGISATAGEMRSQMQNRKRALGRLRKRVAIEVREPYPPANSIDLQLPLNPVSIGLIFDALAAQGFSISDTAKSLGLSTGNLVELIFADTDVRSEVNRCRSAAGLRTLVGK